LEEPDLAEHRHDFHALILVVDACDHGSFEDQEIPVSRIAFTEVPRADAREARSVEPVTVAEVEFTGWTRDRRVRHPSLKGIREDKEAREVTIETPADR
jgi:ATP-dependent DNA ligase